MESTRIAPLANSNGYFYITSNGTAYSTRTGKPKLLKPRRNNMGGSLEIHYTRPDGTQSTQRLDKAVAQAFLPPAPQDYVLIHIDGDDTNCKATNLKWIQPQDLFLMLEKAVMQAEIDRLQQQEQTT